LPAPQSPGLQINLRYNQNTLEQTVLAAVAWSGLGLALPVTIRVDAAEIWGDFRDEVTQWHRVARVLLAG